MKPNYCTQPQVPKCTVCSLVSYGLDCHNNPISLADDDIEDIPITTQIYNHKSLYKFVPSEKSPHIDALSKTDLINDLSVDQLAQIVKLMQETYRNGQASMVSEKIDEDMFWINGVGGLERQPNGTWKLIMPDTPDAIDTSIAAAAIGKKGGKVKSAAKTAAARNNGKKGGRPRKIKD